ncbi:PREDICTED: uncharacterized protein LOC101309305 isoform 2 [Fragaria vesca subsp. vesca]
MAAETDARCQGDVRKLSFFFEKLGASSPPDTRKSSEITNRKGCGGSAGSGTCTGCTPVVSMGLNEFRRLVAGGGASVDKRQWFTPALLVALTSTISHRGQLFPLDMK